MAAAKYVMLAAVFDPQNLFDHICDDPIQIES